MPYIGESFGYAAPGRWRPLRSDQTGDKGLYVLARAASGTGCWPLGDNPLAAKAPEQIEERIVRGLIV